MGNQEEWTAAGCGKAHRKMALRVDTGETKQWASGAGCSSSSPGTEQTPDAASDCRPELWDRMT